MTMSQNQYQYEQDLKNLGLGENKKLVIEGKDCIVYRHPVHGTLNGYLKVDEKISLDEAFECSRGNFYSWRFNFHRS